MALDPITAIADLVKTGLDKWIPDANAREEAALKVEHAQKQRNSFIRQYFGVNPHNPWHYDIVLSTDHLSLDQSAEIIINAFKTKFPKFARQLKS